MTGELRKLMRKLDDHVSIFELQSSASAAITHGSSRSLAATDEEDDAIDDAHKKEVTTVSSFALNCEAPELFPTACSLISRELLQAEGTCFIEFGSDTHLHSPRLALKQSLFEEHLS